MVIGEKKKEPSILTYTCHRPYMYFKPFQCGIAIFILIFCYKHIYKEISKLKSDFSGGPKCKSTVRYDIGTTQCDDGTVKCEEKKKTLNVTKVLSNVMLVLSNVIMEPIDVRKKK